MVVQATETVGQDDADLPAATPAGHQAGKERDGPVRQMQPFHAILAGIRQVRAEDFRDLLLALAHRVPECIIHDPQMRNLCPDPCAFRVRARDALAGGRVLDEAQPVPDQNARVKLVVDDAGAAIAVAPDAGIAPCTAKRAGNAVPVQIDSDGLGAFARCELAEDAADGVGFLRDDFPVAPDRLAVTVQLLHHLVAVAETTTGLALLHPPAKAAMGLHGKVFQEQGVHRAFQPDMQFRDLSLGQCDDGDAREFQLLEERGDIG